jgi:hypothetical protein
MSNLGVLSELGGRKPWLIWVFIFVIFLLFLGAVLLWNFVFIDGGGKAASDLGDQLFGNTSLPI